MLAYISNQELSYFIIQSLTSIFFFIAFMILILNSKKCILNTLFYSIFRIFLGFFGDNNFRALQLPSNLSHSFNFGFSNAEFCLLVDPFDFLLNLVLLWFILHASFFNTLYFDTVYPCFILFFFLTVKSYFSTRTH